ncbi:hypothetical protein K450DRAFT_286044 [Umbelopsis ramanniana AG]|uniref:Retrotransposon gag domain-containing protein n=1 Tax=Umbelopsis ramanniana AG TaxID=1314678 RepID=A0AAD5DZP5_UMBRA|nr:uncharacterized protein K450DRAFT_286044 [Umbelopsis ramanniana AG]KAI8574928.1 hypothetical protein K450DRAFT_286044 [Umbelopsis ramanniana AG]
MEMPSNQGIPRPMAANHGSAKISSTTLKTARELLNDNKKAHIPYLFFQTLNIPYEPVLKEPPHFSGSYPEDPKAFILKFDKVAKANSWNNTDRCMNVLPLCFSGLAEEWFDELMIQKPSFSSWLTDPSAPGSSFEEVFLKQFLTPGLLREFRLRCDLRRQTASESGISYCEEKLTLITMADPYSDWDEDIRLSIVIEGLEEQRRLFVDIHNPKDLNELRKFISFADSRAINDPMLRMEKELLEIKNLVLCLLDELSSSPRHRVQS